MTAHYSYHCDNIKAEATVPNHSSIIIFPVPQKEIFIIIVITECNLGLDLLLVLYKTGGNFIARYHHILLLTWKEMRLGNYFVLYANCSTSKIYFTCNSDRSAVVTENIFRLDLEKRE